MQSADEEVLKNMPTYSEEKTEESPNKNYNF